MAVHRGSRLYAIVLGRPAQTLNVKSLAVTAHLLDKKIASIRLLGSPEKVQWTQQNEALSIEAPQSTLSDAAVFYEIMLEP